MDDGSLDSERRAIRQVVENWVMWRDSGDWDRFATVWHDDGWMTATWFQGPARDFIAASRAAFERGVNILHTLGGWTCDIAGIRAISQTRMAIHQRAPLGGVVVDVTCTGRFYDFFERRGGRWGIVRRQPISEKDRLDAVDPAARVTLDPALLARFPEGYRHLAYLQVKNGFAVKGELPGLRGPAVEQLYMQKDATGWVRLAESDLTPTTCGVQHPPPQRRPGDHMRRLARSIVLAAIVFAPTAAAAQVDLSGSWGARYHEDLDERIPGPELGDFLGLPINDAARQWALSWNPSRLTLAEHQCQVHVAPYIYRGPLQLRIWEERDPASQKLLAIKNYISTYEQTRTIWMDGRPHPPEYAAHTWEGFSTGRWDGDMLTVETTHIKQGWIRRNGLPESDRATLVEHFIRHGDYLTHISIVTDPVYLTEPLVKSQNFVLSQRQLPEVAWLWPCEIVEEVAGRAPGAVPHYPRGQNPFANEFATKHGIPIEATMGGAETMYPEYMLKLQQASSSKSKPR